jgi:hypothetical protein
MGKHGPVTVVSRRAENMSYTRHIATTDPAPGPTVVVESRRATPWAGVVAFGGVMLVLGGAFHVVMGLVALFNPTYYLVTSSGLVATLGYTWWGWAHLILGGLAVLAGIGVFGGRTWARVLGIGLAAVSAIVNVAFVAAYPVWAMILVTVDILVIYALAMHGRELRDQDR